MSKVLITRSLIDALPIAEALKERGQDPLVSPLFKVVFYPLSEIEAVQGLIVTSKNAVRAIESYGFLKNYPVFGVGDQTIELAHQLGFTNTWSAAGDGRNLLELVLKHSHPHQGPLYHISGDVIKIDFVAELRKYGFQAERRTVYSIQPFEKLPLSIVEGLEKGELSYCLFFSFKTAQIFVNLVNKENLGSLTLSLVALCLSEDVAKAIDVLKWKEIWVSPQPNQEALIGYFDEKKQRIGSNEKS